MDDELSADERRSLDFYALETLTKCMLAFAIEANPALEARIVDLFENSVSGFTLAGVSDQKALAGREYMLQRGLEWIASAANHSRK